MRRRQRILKWLVAVVFAAVAVGGQALHDLPGCGHRLCGVAVHAHGHEECTGHGCHPADGTEQPASDESDSPSTGTDCQICKFFSQSKIVDAPAVAVESQPLVVAVSLPPRVFYPIACPSAFDARGPPAVVAVVAI
jgi:hypothetical protein